MNLGTKKSFFLHFFVQGCIAMKNDHGFFLADFGTTVTYPVYIIHPCCRPTFSTSTGPADLQHVPRYTGHGIYIMEYRYNTYTIPSIVSLTQGVLIIHPCFDRTHVFRNFKRRLLRSYYSILHIYIWYTRPLRKKQFPSVAIKH